MEVMEVANTLAYCNPAMITGVKSFYSAGPRDEEDHSWKDILKFYMRALNYTTFYSSIYYFSTVS
jgi:hypothetical protein